MKFHNNCQLTFELKNYFLMEKIVNLPKTTTKISLEKTKIRGMAEIIDKRNYLVDILARFKDLKALDLSSNRIESLVPDSFEITSQHTLPKMASLNISDNPIEQVSHTIAQIQQLMPNLTDLQISLFKEEDVDFIMNHMPQLLYLNNLPVERDETISNTSITAMNLMVETSGPSSIAFNDTEKIDGTKDEVIIDLEALKIPTIQE